MHENRASFGLRSQEPRRNTRRFSIFLGLIFWIFALSPLVRAQDAIPAVSISSSSRTISETSSWGTAIMIWRTGENSHPLTVYLSWSGPGAQTSEITTSAAGGGLPSAITIGAGESQYNIFVAATANYRTNGNRAFTVRIQPNASYDIN